MESEDVEEKECKEDNSSGRWELTGSRRSKFDSGELPPNEDEEEAVEVEARESVESRRRENMVCACARERE